MGSFDIGCALSGLGISPGEPCKLILIAKGPTHEFILTTPQDAIYDDCGFFKGKNLFSQWQEVLGPYYRTDNRFPLEKLDFNDQDHREKIFIDHRRPKQVVMRAIRSDVWDTAKKFRSDNVLMAREIRISQQKKNLIELLTQYKKLRQAGSLDKTIKPWQWNDIVMGDFYNQTGLELWNPFISGQIPLDLVFIQDESQWPLWYEVDSISYVAWIMHKSLFHQAAYGPQSTEEHDKIRKKLLSNLSRLIKV